jgi:hypothetical protein
MSKFFISYNFIKAFMENMNFLNFLYFRDFGVFYLLKSARPIDPASQGRGLKLLHPTLESGKSNTFNQ